MIYIIKKKEIIYQNNNNKIIKINLYNKSNITKDNKSMNSKFKNKKTSNN